MYGDRVVSGMRILGASHLGQYHGTQKNWIKLRSKVLSLFLIATRMRWLRAAMIQALSGLAHAK